MRDLDADTTKLDSPDREELIRSLDRENKALRQEFGELKAELEFQSQRRAEMENRLSIHPVTGLPTHYQMDIELRDMLAALEAEPQARAAVAIIQLGATFEAVKRTFKSSVSEWILYQAATRTRESLGPEGLLFHTRENEFIAVMRYRSREELEERLRACLRRQQEPHIFSGFNLSIGCTVGISLYPEHGREKGQLLHRADIALGASAEGKRPWTLFEERLEACAIERMQLQNAIVKAIQEPISGSAGSQFAIYFQPKVVIKRLDGPRIEAASIGAEALIRWRHPSRGLLPPSKFIGIAEETGLIVPLGKWLLFQTAKKMAAWRLAGLDALDISVNLSPRQFHSAEVAGVLERLIEAEGLDPRRIVLEITETSLFEDPVSALGSIERFKDMGFRISVDDFGTGYSSMSHLHRFPIDEIKIDRSFIRHYPESKRDQAIVDSLASIAEHLGIGLIAEGVERLDQLERLHSLGCGVQGYIFSHPLAEEDFLAWVGMVQANGMIIQVEG